MAAARLVRMPYQPNLPPLDEPLPQGWTRKWNDNKEVVYVSLNPNWEGEGSEGKPLKTLPTKSAWDFNHKDKPWWVLPEGWTQAPDKNAQDDVKNTIGDVQEELRQFAHGTQPRTREIVESDNHKKLRDLTDKISPNDAKKKELQKVAERLEEEAKSLGSSENPLRSKLDKLIEDYSKFQGSLLPHTCDFVNQKSGQKQKTRPEEEARLEDLRLRIQYERNRLHQEGNEKYFCKEILGPMAFHGAHTIYAPDEAAIRFGRGVYNACKFAFGGEDKTQRLQSFLGTGKVRFTIVMIALAVVFLKIGETWTPGSLSQPLTSWLSSHLQDIHDYWTTYNRSLEWYTLYLSICVLMCLRLFVSNILPFTSPLFAIFITNSMPAGREWAASIYLLACSAPAGLVIPFFDGLLYKLVPGDGCGTSQEKINRKFQFTKMVSSLTDYLPFSFWVRTCFMEPVYAAVEAAGHTEANCASAAVVAGHFMIWAGPATTMYQRNYVPDVLTCFFIQPLGLLEDVAVVLATWATHSSTSRVDAQIGMYLFMACMNVVDFLAGKRSTKLLLEHLMVLFCTIVAAYQWYRNTACLMPEHPEFACPVFSQTTTTTTSTSQADSNANLHAAIGICLQVTCVAFWGRLMSRLIIGGFSNLCFNDEDEEKGLDETLLSAQP